MRLAVMLAMQLELRAYYDDLLTPEIEEDLRKGEGVGQASKDTWKKMAADGCLIATPHKRFRLPAHRCAASAVRRTIRSDRRRRRAVPSPAVTTAIASGHSPETLAASG